MFSWRYEQFNFGITLLIGGIHHHPHRERLRLMRVCSIKSQVDVSSPAVPVIDWKPQNSSGYGEGKKKQTAGNKL